MSSPRPSESGEELSAIRFQGGEASGDVIATTEPLSFWGGVDPATGMVIDVHHPLHGICLSGRVLVIPTSRGSCSGSGVLLDMILNGRAPSAIIFAAEEEVLTLGAIVAAQMFGKQLPILRASPQAFARIAASRHVQVAEAGIDADGSAIRIVEVDAEGMHLDDTEISMLDGAQGAAAAQAMRILVDVAKAAGASRFIAVERAHIDGCIYASPANLTFAETMVRLGARVRLPTTTNAISVDHCNWRRQDVPAGWGEPAARLAECYVEMGCKPTFTCSPYLLRDRPQFGEAIAWAESNAVIFANSVLGARTNKHPDFLDLCMAITGRAPLAGVYLDENRLPSVALDIEWPEPSDASIWPVIGYLAGHASPNGIPLLRGLAERAPSQDDLKAMCAAFGTTSAAPMLHVDGITPEALSPIGADLPAIRISAEDLRAAWTRLNAGPAAVDLVAIGSPHASAAECRDLAAKFAGRSRHPSVSVIVTAGRDAISEITRDGTHALLEKAGVRVLPDLCWCSIREPLFPEAARVVMTNSGKYAHYGPGLSGRTVRFGSLSDCMEAALTGMSPPRL